MQYVLWSLIIISCVVAVVKSIYGFVKDLKKLKRQQRVYKLLDIPSDEEFNMLLEDLRNEQVEPQG